MSALLTITRKIGGAFLSLAVCEVVTYGVRGMIEDAQKNIKLGKELCNVVDEEAIDESIMTNLKAMAMVMAEEEEA